MRTHPQRPSVQFSPHPFPRLSPCRGHNSLVQSPRVALEEELADPLPQNSPPIGRKPMAPNNTRTILVIGAAVVAGGLAEGTAFAQAPPAPAAAAPAAHAAPATPTFVPLYPGPGFPTCIVKAATDCRLPDGHPDLTGLYVAGGATGQAVFQNGLNSGTLGITFAGRGDNFVGFEADGGLFRETRDYGTPGVGLNQPATTVPPQYR